MQTSHNILQISVNKINEIIFIKLQEIKSIQNSINRISKKNPDCFLLSAMDYQIGAVYVNIHFK